MKEIKEVWNAILYDNDPLYLSTDLDNIIRKKAIIMSTRKPYLTN